MGFKEKLVEKLQNELSEEELALLPRGFQTVGKCIIIKLKPELMDKKHLIAKAYLEALPYIRSVYINAGVIEGQFREPQKIEYLAGEDDPVVKHKEHGVIYTFDITKIMFSQGNLKERKYLASLVEDGEIIVDMFAGIGYFSLPIAVLSNPEKIYSIELNPVAYKYLLKNVKLNNAEEIIVPILGDCKEKVIELKKKGIKADRVIMGVFPAPEDYINEALMITKDSGAVIHYEGVVDKEEKLKLYDQFSEMASKSQYSTKLLDSRFVKSVGPNLYHQVVDIKVSKKV